MEVSAGILKEADVLLASFAMGVLLLFVYDVLRIVRRIVPHKMWLVGVQDLVLDLQRGGAVCHAVPRKQRLHTWLCDWRSPGRNAAIQFITQFLGCGGKRILAGKNSVCPWKAPGMDSPSTEKTAGFCRQEIEKNYEVSKKRIEKDLENS